MSANPGETDAWRGRALDAQSDFVCLVDDHGKVKCPGNDPRIEGAWPDQQFSTVDTGIWGTCGLRVDGQAVCRSSFYDPGTLPSGPWRMLSVGYSGGCGVRPDGGLGCWGQDAAFAARAPVDGPFLSVSVGSYDGCAIRLDGTLACWNVRMVDDPDFGPPPPGRYLRVDVGPFIACALRSDGGIACWGPGRDLVATLPAGSDFIDVSVGSGHVCALSIDGAVVCHGVTNRWGTVRQMPSPDGRFAEIASEDDRACGRRTDGVVTCWGEAVSDDALLQSGETPLARVTTGGGEVCALDADGHASCFGEQPALAPPPGRYLDLALGADRACSIDLRHRLRCWGVSPDPAPLDLAPLDPVPQVPMSSVVVAGMHACGLDMDAQVLCWGADAVGLSTVPRDRYRTVVTGDDYACALSMDGVVTCWGTHALVSAVPVGSGFAHLFAGSGVACASRDIRPPVCWGEVKPWMDTRLMTGYESAVVGDHFLCWLQAKYPYCVADPAVGPPVFSNIFYIAIAATGDTVCTIDHYAGVRCVGARPSTHWVHTLRAGHGRLAAGASHTCNIDDAGHIDCWGRDDVGQASPAVDGAHDIDANGDHTCVADATYFLHCWGDDRHDANLPPPGLQVRDVDLGQFGGCGIGHSGDAVCWGWNVNGQASPPAGAFRRVASGLNHGCGVRDDGTLACWGYGADGQTAAPAGTYLTVDVGERHSCAIAGDSRLRCWGLDSEGQSTPPADDARYVALAVGTFHACAIRGDGALACWGRNDHGQATPPAGRFVSVAAGGAHTCAVREDGTRACWGDNGTGQAPSLSFTPATLPPAVGGYRNPYEAQFTVAGSGGYVPRNPRFRMIDAGQLDPAVLSEDGHLFLYTYDDHALYRFTVEVRDANGFVARREYTVQVGPSVDATPPEIGATISGPMGDNGWYNGDVEIAWQVDDRESGIVDVAGCDARTITDDFVSYVTCIATNRAGVSRSESRYIRRDATPPRIFVWYWPESAPNANGWYQAPEHAYFACDDLTSGTLGPCPPDADFLTEGVHIPPLHTVRDRAGNIATTPQAPIRIDWTAPTLDAVMPPSQLPAGAVHDYHATASDALSGVDSLVCTPVDSTPDAGPGGPERTAECVATDRAGNATVMRSTYTVVAPVAPAKTRILRASRLPAARARSGHRAAR